MEICLLTPSLEKALCQLNLIWWQRLHLNRSDLSGALPQRIIEGNWQQWTDIIVLFLNSFIVTNSDMVISSVLEELLQLNLAGL